MKTKLIILMLCTFITVKAVSFQDQATSLFVDWQELLDNLDHELVATGSHLVAINQKNEAVDLALQKLGSMYCPSQLECNPSGQLCGSGERWVLFACLTSPDIVIVKKHGAYYVTNKDSSKYYSIDKGDHNMWFCNDGSLRGHDIHDHMFHRQPTVGIV